RTMSCERTPRACATNPMPHASCSSRGSYNPCAKGSSSMLVLRVSLGAGCRSRHMKKPPRFGIEARGPDYHTLAQLISRRSSTLDPNTEPRLLGKGAVNKRANKGARIERERERHQQVLVSTSTGRDGESSSTNDR